MFPDALRLVQRLLQAGVPLAAASSSRNANMFLERVPLPWDAAKTLLDVFNANVCGMAFTRGKPDPEIFLSAAAALGAGPQICTVVEDAPSGIMAAKSGGMRAVGIARLNDAALLGAAGADLVVTSLDEVVP